ncbi:T9SS type A sorting domain-containing protein [Flavobacterium sp.]|uniref:T9SS type A sorting domain-containing protein n=1 Tax=Flavobacterium sp. TaxID=239 RepID=UPI0035AE77B3
MKTLKLLLLLLTSVTYGQYSENFNTANSFSQTTSLYVGSTCSRLTPPIQSNNAGASGGGAIRIQDYSGISQQDQILRINGINTLNANTLSFNINWEIPSSIGSQQLRPLIVEYSTNSGSTWISFSPYQTLVHFNITWSNVTITLPLASKYAALYLRFKPANNLGNTGSQVRNIYVDDIKTDNSLSNEEHYIEGFKIFPNPAKDKFTLDFGNETISKYTIKINNLIGQEVYRTIVDKPQFEVSKTWQGQGVYFVKICDDNNNLLTIKKIILQ